MKTNNTIESSLNEMQRLREEHQLHLAFNNLENKTGVSICYLNVRSLRSNITHILADKWYSRCDVLIFSETCTYSNEQILIPGFEVFYRSDALAYPAFVKKNVAKGVICFAKIGIQIDVKNSCQTFKADAKGNYLSHVNLISFLVHDTLILTGYKSPKTVMEQFKTAFSEFNLTSVCPTVLLGDFNFNLNDTCSNQVQQFRSMVDALHLKDCLQSKEATTILGSRLDVLFSNIVNLQTGVYECYFSDHKPIFAILENHNNSPKHLLKTSNVRTSLNEPKIICMVQSNSSTELKSTSVECINSEPVTVHDNIFYNDRNIETCSIQCSDIDSKVNSANFNFNCVDWLNSIDDPSNTFDCTSKEILNKLRVAYLNFNIHEELDNWQSIMMYETSVNYITNYLKVLPAIYFNTNRDAQHELSIQELVGFKEIAITGAGNCQFNSISYALVGNEDFSIDLRIISFLSVVENLRSFKNFAENQWLESNTVHELLKICCTIGQYGNMDTLFAISMTLERCIIIVQIQNGKHIFLKIKPPQFDSTTTPIVLRLTNPGTHDAHYNVLLPEDASTSCEFPGMEAYDLRSLL